MPVRAAHSAIPCASARSSGIRRTSVGPPSAEYVADGVTPRTRAAARTGAVRMTCEEWKSPRYAAAAVSCPARQAFASARELGAAQDVPPGGAGRAPQRQAGVDP